MFKEEEKAVLKNLYYLKIRKNDANIIGWKIHISGRGGGMMYHPKKCNTKKNEKMKVLIT